MDWPQDEKQVLAEEEVYLRFDGASYIQPGGGTAGKTLHSTLDVELMSTYFAASF